MRHLTLSATVAAVLAMLLLFTGSSPADATFTPSFAATIDDSAVPNDPATLPSSDNCETNGVAFPGGIACEMHFQTTIPMGDEIGRSDLSLPRPRFTIAPGVPLSNGSIIGAFGFTSGVQIGPTCVQNFVVVPPSALPLRDSALPDYSSGPWMGVSNGGTSEGPEVSGPAALFNHLVWPTNLESDVRASAYWAAGYKLIARYSGVAPTGGPGTPVNVLVFESAGAYFGTYITGDPAAPPPPATFCTALTISADYLGSTTDIVSSLPVQLRQCDVTGTDTITATFTSTIGSTAVVTDTVNCFSVAPPTASPTPAPTPPPLGTVTGVTFHDVNGNGIFDGGDVGFSGITVCVQSFGCTSSGAGGIYSLSVPSGNRVVYAPPAGPYLPTTPMNQPVTVPPGGSVTADFGARQLVPPPPEITIESPCPAGSSAGVPAFIRGCPTPITKDVTAHCGSDSPVAIKLVATPSIGVPLNLPMTNTSGENWTATIPAGSFSGIVALKFYVDCPPDTPGFPENIALIAGEDEIQDGGGLIFIDPSGFITNICNGAPLAGATVILLVEVPSGSDNYTPASSGFIPANNPEISDGAGHYGWLVVAGRYKVRAQLAGFSTEETVPYDIPPEVTDANLALTPNGGCGEPVGGVTDLIIGDTSSDSSGLLALGLGAVLIALVGAAWYSRRRWLR